MKRKEYLEKISPKIAKERILRSSGFGLGLETFANFWRVSLSLSEILISEKAPRLGEDINRKKRFLSGIARIRGGGLPMPGFFGPFFLPSISPTNSIFSQTSQKLYVF